MSDDEVKDKFTSLFAEYGDTVQAERIISVVDNLDKLNDIKDLIDALAKQ